MSIFGSACSVGYNCATMKEIKKKIAYFATKSKHTKETDLQFAPNNK